MGRRRSDEARQHETTDYPMAHLGEEMTPSATGDAGSIPEADIVTFAPHVRELHGALPRTIPVP
jgi:hypothetical protein